MLAGLSDNITWRLWGLAMSPESMGIDPFAPWLEFAIQAFGVDRC
jgi:L-fuconolactonase